MIPLHLRILNRINNKLLWQLYRYKSYKILDRSTLILSFDCDTEEDITVAWDVHQRLQDLGVTPVYAVPGELLKKGHKVYSKIQESGAEFINHGGREHTYFDVKNNRHSSCFFYDQQSYTDLKEDILLGHNILKDVLGVTAKGWRTPHFGTFQAPQQLDFLYDLLSELEYTFSSSTSPSFAYSKGMIHKHGNIFEIPVTGIYNQPLNIMDTWAYFEAPDRVKTPKEYVEAAKSLIELTHQFPVLINIYGDPSHVHNKPEFFEAIKILSSDIHNVNYSQLLEQINEKNRNL